MRLSISENPALAKHAHVFVDGVDVSSRCYGADDVLGEAYCYVMDGKGMIAVAHSPDCEGTNCTLREDKKVGCHLKREVLKGEVRIEVPEDAMKRYRERMSNKV